MYLYYEINNSSYPAGNKRGKNIRYIFLLLFSVFMSNKIVIFLFMFSICECDILLFFKMKYYQRSNQLIFRANFVRD